MVSFSEYQEDMKALEPPSPPPLSRTSPFPLPHSEVLPEDGFP